MTALATYDMSSGTNFTAVSGHNKGSFTGTYQGGFADGNCAAYENAYGSWPNNQYCQAKVTTVSTNSTEGAGPACRHTTGQYYYVRCTTTATTLHKYFDGNRTQIGTAAAVAANSVVKLECDGTTIKVYDDGVEIISVTDSSLTGGQPGVYAYGGSSSFGALDDWEAGDLTAGGVTPPTPIAALPRLIVRH